MLGLLRKYQKSVFLIVSVLAITSLVFSGAISTLTRTKSAPNRVIGTTFDGRKVREREFFNLMRFISTDRQDVELWQKGSVPNFLNDGVIRNDLIASGLAVKLAEKRFEELSDSLETALSRAKRFRSYSHPQAPFISAENVWNQFVPNLAHHLSALKHPEAKANLESFKTLAALYLDQTQFPSTILRQLLGFQEKQYSWIPHDHAIDRSDLSLLSAHSLEEWFGPRFIELSAQVILNGAAMAEKRGYRVTYPEARMQLYQNAIEMIRSETGKSEVTADELTQCLGRQFAILQMDEKSAVEAWRQVMLFRTLMSDMSHVSFLDPLLYEDFLAFAHDATQVAHYHLPEDLKLKDIYDLAQFQRYLESLGADSNSVYPPLADHLETKVPELLQNRYKIEVAHISLARLAREVGVKQTWEWECQEKNWNQLAQKFPQLGAQILRTAEERLNFLEALDEPLRDQIDDSAREMIALASSASMREALLKESFREKEIWITKTGLSNLMQASALTPGLDQLLNRPLTEEIEIYSPDQKNFFAIRAVEKQASDETLTFSQARARGILKEFLDQDLAKAYPKIRSQEPALFKDETGNYRPFDQVKSHVARLYYKPLLNALERELAGLGIKPEGDALSQLDSFYARHRFAPYLNKMRHDIVNGKNLDQNEGLAAQWHIVCDEREILRKNPEAWFSENSFEMDVGTWSEMKADNNGMISFFRVLSKKEGHPDLSDSMHSGQEMIAKEAKEFIFSELLEQMEEADAFAEFALRDHGDR